MKDVARALDVSVSTVARSLADSPRISHDTKARVIAEAEKLGYVIDFAARAMRSGTSSLVGLIVPDLRNDFYSTAAKAISDICHEKGLQLILAITDDDPELELQHIRNLSSSRALGIVIIPSVDPAKETLRLLRVTPHVQLVRKCDKVASDWFGLDDLAAMQLATNHLIELGHRKLAFIGSTTAISTGKARLDGFRRTLAEAGIDPSSAVTESGGCDAEFGYEAMGRILSVKDRPTGIVTAGARISIGAYDAARNAGIDIPGDLSFVGFSDAPAFRWWGASGLTTIGLPVEEIAMSSTSFLLRRAEMRNPPTAPPCEVVHRPVLIRRGSTAPPPAKR